MKQNRGSYSAACCLDKPSVQDIEWWLHNVSHAAVPISLLPPSNTLFTDSTNKSWGAWLNGQYAQSHFSIQELDNIIAVKELLAVLYGLRSFINYFSGTHILIRSDNVGAVAYVRDMGGMCNSIMNDIAKQIWDFAFSHGIWLSISYIKSSHNVLADLASRILNDRTEWALPMSIFTKITKLFFVPDIDLFASQLNTKLDRYISWIPDPYCFEVDSFSVTWTEFSPYLFPPFSILQTDRVPQALVVFLLWTTQHWFLILLHLLTSEICLLPDQPPLFLPWQTITTLHPLAPTLMLAVAQISSIPEKQEIFCQRLPTSSHMELEKGLPRVTRAIINTGFSLQSQGVLIPIYPL